MAVHACSSLFKSLPENLDLIAAASTVAPIFNSNRVSSLGQATPDIDEHSTFWAALGFLSLSKSEKLSKYSMSSKWRSLYPLEKAKRSFSQLLSGQNKSDQRSGSSKRALDHLSVSNLDPLAAPSDTLFSSVASTHAEMSGEISLIVPVYATLCVSAQEVTLTDHQTSNSNGSKKTVFSHSRS